LAGNVPEVCLLGSSLIPQLLIPVNRDLAYILPSLDTLSTLHYGC